MTVSAEHPRQATDPVDMAMVDSAIHRAETLAIADPASGLAHQITGELTDYLGQLIAPAEQRLANMTARKPADQRARDVLGDTIRHARSVHHDAETDQLVNPTARLHLLAGACRLLKQACEPRW
ncbi:hypothetical protein [Streptomyces sp. SAS_270]|uniref:hypothetical protein n=1 Tax=Streptomyces sp. SAS_270 TaxID=3412748 RepID=UPI00403C8DC5